jgi:ubiquinone biosynthesis protein COQ9
LAATENVMEDNMQTAKDAVLDAALTHVPFDGWSEATFRAAVADSGVADGLARALFPRGAVDLALAYHARGDAAMAEHALSADLASLRYSERVAALIRFRLEVAEKEAVRRGTTLFALPNHAADGAKAIWGTADAIWKALGDTSTDLNWYTKRATLSAVYGATVLYWLGDDSPDHLATWEFLDRRIADVMRVEKFKASVRANSLVKAVLDGPLNVFSKVRAPVQPDDLPGMFRK